MNESKSILSRIVGFLGSFTLASILFILLFILTFFGTLEQQHASLHDVRTKYFDSPFFLTEYGIPLPGASLLLAILFVNLVVGGMLRMRRSWSRLGIFAIHIGIAFLLLSSLVEGIFSKKGIMTIWEGESDSEFQSSEYWDVSILEQLPEGRQRSYTIPSGSLPGTGEKARFRAEGLPFEVELAGHLRNCRPRRAPAGSDSIEGIVLEEFPPDRDEVAQNIPGITVAFVSRDLRREALLWGFPDLPPYVTTIDGRNWAVEIHRRRWPLPFTVALRDFTHEMHPGTGVAKSFSSDVTRIENNVAQDVHISMNDPMRHRGYIFYQSGYGPQPAAPGARMYSTFSVVENPADRGPWIAVTIIGLGLLGHMLHKLLRHMDAESRRRA